MMSQRIQPIPHQRAHQMTVRSAPEVSTLIPLTTHAEFHSSGAIALLHAAC